MSAIRLFCALALPGRTRSTGIVAWQASRSSPAAADRPAREPARHARVPRRAGPRPTLPASPRELASRGAAAGADPARGARLPRDAERRHDRARRRRTAREPRSRTTCSAARRGSASTSRERRRWLPHVTVLRFRRAAAPAAGAARPRRGQSVRCGCLPFRAAPRRGAVRGSRNRCTRRLIRWIARKHSTSRSGRSSGSSARVRS